MDADAEVRRGEKATGRGSTKSSSSVSSFDDFRKRGEKKVNISSYSGEPQHSMLQGAYVMFNSFEY